MLTEGTGEKGLAPFSQMQWQPENDVGMCDPEARQLREEGARWTPKSLGKIINKIDNLELKMRKMSLSDEQRLKNLRISLKWPLLDVEEETGLGEQIEPQNPP